MNQIYESLFQPIKIGGAELSNRVLFPGHGTGLSARTNSPSDAHIAYLTERVKGGVALVITEIAQIEQRAIYSSQALRVVSDEQIPSYRRLADAIHRENGHVFVQLFHPGREMHVQPDGRAGIAWAPSEVPTDANHVMPRPMSVQEINQTVEQFALAAVRIERAGIDGVEIVGTHGFLPSQFLNPAINHRTDQYGGPLHNRLRFLREIIHAIRSMTKPGFVVGLRICTDEGHPQGLKPDTSVNACAELDRDKNLDYFSVTTGTVSDHGGAIGMIPPMGGGESDVTAQSTLVKQVVSAPVFVVGRIHQMSVAAGIITNGHADMVGMVRANICDPEITKKTREGKHDDIRVCIACNQTCIGHRHSGASLSCIQNPVAGRELVFADPPEANPRKTILVAGGGPGGMKAAAVGAARGHSVTLVEQTDTLGGQVLLAQRLPGRAEFGGIVTNLTREITLANVEVVLNTTVTRTFVEKHAPDVVILATGAKPYHPPLEGREEGHVVDAWSVIRGEANVGTRVVIADWACDWIGLGVAEMLAREGCNVRLAVNGRMAGEQLHAYTRDRWVGELFKLGVQVVPYARLFGVDKDTVYFQHLSSDEPLIMEGVDTLVTATGHMGKRDLELALEGYPGEVYAIGDCQSARTAEEAILEGMEISTAL